MTQQKITYPGSYKLKTVSISPSMRNDRRIAVEMRNLVPTLSLTESMLSDSIRGSMNVLDSSGLLEKYPIRGEENLYIEMEDALGNIRKYNFFVYRVDNVKISNNSDTLSYTLHFVSRQRFLADQKRVTASFNKPISGIAQEIFDRYCRDVSYSGPKSRDGFTDINKLLTVEETEGNVRLIIPRLTPMQAMKFVESRAYSSRSPSCSFRFFESADSFYFVTDEFLVNKAVSEDKIFEFSYASNLPHDVGNILQQMSNFNSMTNIARVDTFDDMHSGAYKNKVVVLDIVNRVTNIAEPSFDYTAADGDYFQTAGDVIDRVDKHSDSFISTVFNEDNARRFLMVRDFAEEDAGQLRGEQFLSQITSNRLSYFNNLGSLKLSSSGVGRLDITCGDLIRMELPEYISVNRDPKLNPQLSGVYMVEAISRVFDKENYTNHYTLVKRKWARQPTGEERFLIEIGGDT